MRRVPGVALPRRVHLGTPLVVQRPRLDDGKGTVVSGNFVWGDQEVVTYFGPPGHIVSLPRDGGSVVLLARSAVTVSGNGYEIRGSSHLEAGEARRFTRWGGLEGWLSEKIVMTDMPVAPVAGSGEKGNGLLVVTEAPVHVVRDETRERGGSHVRTVIRAPVGGLTMTSNGSRKGVR
jgi:hypothetical protein